MSRPGGDFDPVMPSPYSPIPYPAAAPSLTFVLHDAGETKAMMPVMASLERSGVDYAIMAESTARTVLAGHPRMLPSFLDVSRWSAAQPAMAQWGAMQLNRAMQAKTVLTGLVSDFQLVWAQWFRQMGRRVIGYYDGFTINRQFNKAETFLPSLTHLVTSSRDTAQFFQSRAPYLPVVPLGQPTLETIAQSAQQVNRPALATRLGLNATRPTVLFVGGYGNHYNESFRLFCEGVKQLPSSVNVVVSLHPKVPGNIERQYLEAYGLTQRVRLAPKSIATDHLIGMSDVVLCQDSTMAVPAMFQGKSVLFVGPPVSGTEADGFNPLRQFGLAQRALDPATLVGSVSTLLKAQTNGRAGVPTPDQLANQLGIPSQATQRIAGFLQQTLYSP